jgi:hypothetical protein
LADNFGPDEYLMLELPDGTILCERGADELFIYLPDGAPLASAQPVILGISLNSNGSYHLVGTLFNGISQGAMYGDDFQMDSNPNLQLEQHERCNWKQDCDLRIHTAPESTRGDLLRDGCCQWHRLGSIVLSSTGDRLRQRAASRGSG